MGKKPGSSSLPAPPPVPVDFGTNALVMLGIVASLTFIAGSAVLNYRMGYNSAGNATDGTIYGALAAAGDGLKAVSPFAAGYAWKKREWVAVAAAVVIFSVLSAYSFTSSLGFSSQHRAHKEGVAAAEMERHSDTRKTVTRDRKRLDELGPQRSSAEVKQALDNLLDAPIGAGRWTVRQVSEGCAKNKRTTKKACATVATLKLEHLRAEEAEHLAAEVKSLTVQKPRKTIVTSADPQTDALAFLGRLLHLLPKGTTEYGQSEHAGDGLALLMALFIELGSGFGLFVATTPWRSRAPVQIPEPKSPSLPAMEGGPPLEMFAAERLQRKTGHALQLAIAFESYKEWCEQRNKTMQGRTRFERGLLKLAKELGLDVDNGLSGWVIRDVALRNSSPMLR